MKTTFLFVLLLFSAVTILTAQQFPIYTQHMANPYVINPGAIASQQVPEFNIAYRQQWAGINNSPKTIQADIQLPINNKVFLGVNIVNDRSILLSQFSGYLTFGYLLPFTKTSFIKFGISGGLISNQIKLEDLGTGDPNDPALLSSQNNLDFDGQFGAVYSNNRLSIGISLLKFVESKSFSSDDNISDYSFDPIKDKAAYISYRIKLSEKVELQPNFLYRTTFTGSTYYEGTGLFNIANRVSVGGGYRTDFGPLAILRIGLSKFSPGFSYDFPSGSTTATREFQLKYLLKKTKAILAQEENKVKNNTETTIAESNLTEEKTEQVEVAEIVEDEELVTNSPSKPNANDEVIEVDHEASEAALKQKDTDDIQIDKPSTEPIQAQGAEKVLAQEQAVIPEEKVGQSTQTTNAVKPNNASVSNSNVPTQPKYLFIVGSFSNKLNAIKLIDKYKKQGIVAQLKIFNGSYYVHIPEFSTDEISMDKLMDIRYNTPHTEGWFKSIQ